LVLFVSVYWQRVETLPAPQRLVAFPSVKKTMEDLVDEKKPFDAELQEEETQPDPDEQLMLEQGNGRVWLVKVRSESRDLPSPWAYL
jgi:hypothetical protein